MRRRSKTLMRTGQRRGYAALLVLACCSVAVALVMLSLRTGLKQRRQLRNEHQLEPVSYTHLTLPTKA